MPPRPTFGYASSSANLSEYEPSASTVELSSPPRLPRKDRDIEGDWGNDSHYPSYYLSPAANGRMEHSASSLSLQPNGSEETAERHLTRHAPSHPPTPSLPVRLQNALLHALFPESRPLRLYLITVLIETFLDLVIEAIILYRVNRVLDSQPKDDDRAKSRLPVYLSIFGLAHVFQFCLALDAVYWKNTLQFIFLTVFNALFLVYAIIQIFEIRTLLEGKQSSGLIPSQALTIAIPIVICIAQVAYIALGLRIHSEFGWDVYKFLGADRRIKRLYGQYQIFQTLMRFDAFFWLGFSVQLISLVLEKGDFEFVLTIVALPLSLLLLVEGHLAARHESRLLMGIFGFGCLAALVYFAFKTFRIWSQRGSETFRDVYKTLTIFAAISIAMLVLTSIWAFLVFRNYGTGLKDTLDKSAKERAAARDAVELNGTKTHGKQASGAWGKSNPYRMSIE